MNSCAITGSRIPIFVPNAKHPPLIGSIVKSVLPQVKLTANIASN